MNNTVNVSETALTVTNSQTETTITNTGNSITNIQTSTTGTSFPTSPYEGQYFYRTDLDEPFWYDSTRSKWLGTELTIFCGSFSLTTNAYFYIGTFVLGSAINGVYLQSDITITGIEWSSNGASSTTYEFMKTGVLQGSKSITEQYGSDRTLDIDISSGGVFALKNASDGSPVTNPIVKITYKRHET